MPPKSSKASSSRKQATVKKLTAAAESLAMLQQTKEEMIKQYNTVKKTDENYNGHLNRGMRFLAEVVGARRKAGIVVCDEGINTEELAKAFNGPAPNEYSAIALERFLTQKCFIEKRSESMAWGIHGAFCRHWDNM